MFATVMHSLTKIKVRFKYLGRYLLGQSLCAACTILLLVMVLGKEKIVAISSIGATAFIIFATPKRTSAQTSNVLGGYLVGLTIGLFFSFLTLHYTAGYPLVVGTTIFVMALFNIHHPPAVAAALAVAIREISFPGIGAILISAIVLSQFRHHMRGRLKDLL